METLYGIPTWCFHMKKPYLKKVLATRFAEKDVKESRMIYVHRSTWAWLADWCRKQDPPRKASQIIEELIEVLREQEGEK